MVLPGISPFPKPGARPPLRMDEFILWADWEPWFAWMPHPERSSGRKNTHKEFEGEFHRWGMTESLLLTDKAVISSPTGSAPWWWPWIKRTDPCCGSQSPGEVSGPMYRPLLIEHNGTRMVLITPARISWLWIPKPERYYWSD